jgi:hypothetical protein
MTGGTIEKERTIARHLLAEHASRTPYHTLTGELALADMAEAYRAQEAFIAQRREASGAGIAGYKIALTSKAMQDFVGVGHPLLGEAFTGTNVDRLLDEQALDFVNHPRGVWVGDGKAMLSAIYDWYAEDFGGTREAVLAHLRLYALPGLRPLLREDLVLDYAFDWSLNDATGSLGKI